MNGFGEQMNRCILPKNPMSSRPGAFYFPGGKEALTAAVPAAPVRVETASSTGAAPPIMAELGTVAVSSGMAGMVVLEGKDSGVLRYSNNPHGNSSIFIGRAVSFAF